MKESLTSFETRIAGSEFYLDSMCSISPEGLGIKKVFIQLRPQPDPSYDQVSIKVKLGDARFRTMDGCGIYSVPDLELIAGVEVLNKNQHEELFTWVNKNQHLIKRFWLDEDFLTDELLKRLTKLTGR